MLDNELHDRESHDNTTGGPGAGDINAAPAVPAAVFQPPQVVFQPPAARPESAGKSESAPPARPDTAGRPETAGQAGSADRRDPRRPVGDGVGDDDDGTGTGRRRRRRSSRTRGRTGDQDTAAEGTDAAPESQDSEPGQDASAGTAGSGSPAGTAGSGSPAGAAGSGSSPDGGQGESRRSSSRSRSRRAAKSGAGGDGTDAQADAPAAEAPADDSGDGDAGSADGDGDAGSSGRRRRRKRRRGSAGDGPDAPGSDDPPDTVVHVREPNGSDDVRSVKGSTRLEAKKQRRREGRETGRRRPPIVTESEFLARRESVERSMVIRQRNDRTQIAVLEDGVLVEHYVNRSSHQSYVGNVYLGKVQNVLPSMEAAFVDVGKGRNAVLYAGEVNFDVSGLEGQPKRIESALKAGQSVIVQVTKDPVGHKGARLTSQISLPGRYLVYVPGASMTGISRKLPDTERNRLKQILKKVMPENAGVIVRTAAEGAAEEELSRDVSRLAAQWEAIEKKSKTANAPAMLYGEPDLTIRVIRDVFNEDFSKLVVSGEDAWDVVDEYVRYVAPHLADRVTRWQGDRDAFAEYRIDEQLAKALERKVWLPSGGSLVIDKTEAMTVVDVNTGKFTGQGGNLEETVTRNNLEAAEEIVRQLRLRDVGGIVVIDFIDMVLESNRELVLRRLLECLSRDRTKHQVAEVTSLGLVQMTRKRVGAGLLEAFSTPVRVLQRPRRHPHLRSRLRRPRHAAHALPRPWQRRSRQRRSRQRRPRTQPGHGRRPRPFRRVLRARGGLGQRPRRHAPRGRRRRVRPRAPAPGSASADSADPNAAQVANGQVPDTEREPARSSGRRRRRKPSAAAAPATPADTSAQPRPRSMPRPASPAPAATQAPASPGTPAASDSFPVPVTSGAPEPPRPEASAEMPPAQGGAQGGAE